MPMGKSTMGKRCHILKCLSTYFQQIKDGRKTFELRKDDREGGFRVGDYLLLREIDDANKDYTRALQSVIITGHLRDFPGLENGFCILSICPVNYPRHMEILDAYFHQTSDGNYRSTNLPAKLIHLEYTYSY